MVTLWTWTSSPLCSVSACAHTATSIFVTRSVGNFRLITGRFFSSGAESPEEGGGSGRLPLVSEAGSAPACFRWRGIEGSPGASFAVVVPPKSPAARAQEPPHGGLATTGALLTREHVPTRIEAGAEPATVG